MGDKKRAPVGVEEGAARYVYLVGLPWERDEKLNGKLFVEDEVVEY